MSFLRAPSDKTPWLYLLAMFAALAMASVVLPACDTGGTDSGSTNCGDGVVDVEDDEECDDENAILGDGCDDECLVEHECGDGDLDESPDSEEECDDDNLIPGDGCSDICTFESVCGDGVMDGFEECDDGNTTPSDGCDENCQLESTCGDGFITGLEVCDDSNTSPGDGCSTDCLSDETCGNGFVDLGLTEIDGTIAVPFQPFDTSLVFDEVCDDSNTTGGDGCSALCRAAPLSLLALKFGAVSVPICRLPFYGIGNECDMEAHYHQTAYGFNSAGTQFLIKADTDPMGCGHGKGTAIHPTLHRLSVTQDAVNTYLLGTPGSFVCWGE